MTDDKPDQDKDDRTVFQPLPTTPPPAQPHIMPDAATDGAGESSWAGDAANGAAATPSEGSAPEMHERQEQSDATQWGPATPSAFPAAFAARNDGQGIQVGDVLNHIFEVKRFIARGGMGEVFEGLNVTSDERVAIKVMLPSLASDANVIAMFRREARTLTRLQHEALVQYRVLAQEPQLGVLYIVTEYIDGVNLGDVLGDLRPTSTELVALLRRLASGLRTAHSLGAIHRDISPDNVLLEGGRLSDSKIIDFGIAKDLDPGSATIVGDGFAGKLSYVAPEQLGDFGRDVGPWSDVYSLALVVLAVATGRNVAIGGTLVDAVDKRRAGIDLSDVPGDLQPILAKMLIADPAKRLRSMDAVLDEVGKLDAATVIDRPSVDRGGGIRSIVDALVPFRLALMIGGGSMAVAVAALAAWALMPDDSGDVSAVPKAPVVATLNPERTARAAIDSVAPSVTCSWLDIVDIQADAAGTVVKLVGVAGNPAAAQAQISQSLASAGLRNVSIDFADVAPIAQDGCVSLDTYRQIRSSDTRRLTALQPKFEIQRFADRGEASAAVARIVYQFTVGNPATDFVLVGTTASGQAGVFASSRADLESKVSTGSVVRLPNDSFRVELDTDSQGLVGIMLITGKGPFPADLIAPKPGDRQTGWPSGFRDSATRNGWQASMVWVRTVDELP